MDDYQIIRWRTDDYLFSQQNNSVFVLGIFPCQCGCAFFFFVSPFSGDILHCVKNTSWPTNKTILAKMCFHIGSWGELKLASLMPTKAVSLTIGLWEGARRYKGTDSWRASLINFTKYSKPSTSGICYCATSPNTFYVEHCDSMNKH